MDLKQLLSGISEAKLCPECAVSGLASDSRKVSPGDVFIAYKGFHVDGREYIQEALDKGAAAVIYEVDVEDWEKKFSTTIPLVPVPNLQEKIGEMAARFYGHPSKSMTVIGVTGTNGKTSCSQFIAQALSEQQVRCAVLGTMGNGFLPHLQKTTHTTLDPIGLQKALAAFLKQGAEVAVLEASSHALQQHRLQGVHFDIAVFTQLSRDHLDYHGDMKTYAQAKELLFQQPNLTHAVVNIDDEFGQEIIRKYSKKLNIIGYSVKTIANVNSNIPTVMAKKIITTPGGFQVIVATPWGEGKFTTKLLGVFNISNLLVVLSVLRLLQIPFSQALKSLAKLKTVRGRMESFGNDSQPKVVVDYAHTPDALEKALSELREHCRGKLYCVLGCGGDRDRGKRSLMSAIAQRYADYIIMTNDNPRTESPERIIADMQRGITDQTIAKIELDRAAAIRYAVHQACVHDVVLVAGKGHETTQTIGSQILPFDDSEEVMRALDNYVNKKGMP